MRTRRVTVWHVLMSRSSLLSCLIVALVASGSGCDTATPEAPAGALVVSVLQTGKPNAELVAVSLDGQERPFLHLGYAKSAFFPACAPGGRRVAFQREDDADGFAPPRLAVVDDGRVRPLAGPADDPIRGVLGTWAPDGRRIVIARRSPEPPGAFPDDLAVVDVETGTVEALTSGPAADLTPLWSPDGRRIAFVSDRGGERQREVFVIAPDGSGLRQVTALGREVYLAGWGPGPADVTIRVLRTDGSVVIDTWIVDVETGTLRALPAPALPDGTGRFRFETWVTGGTAYVYQTSRGSGVNGAAAVLSLFDVETGRSTRLIERTGDQSFFGTAWCPAAP